MSPPVETFHATELPDRVQITMKGRRRKGDPIELHKCELLEMLQYACEVEKPHVKNSPVICRPVERLFRRCQDRNGPFLVETTAWEDKK